LYNKNLETKQIFSYYGIEKKFNVFFIENFLIKKPGRLSFIIYTILSIGKLINLKFKRNIDFIYFRSEYFLPLALVAKILGISYYYEIHRKGTTKKSEVFKIFLAKYATGLITISKQLADFYIKFNKNVVVAHDAVDFIKFNIDIYKEAARKKINLLSEGLIFLYVGSINKIKGVDIIIRNANRFPQVDFYLVGNIDEVMHKYLEKYKTNNIYVQGQIDNSLVPYYLKAADLLILPHVDNVQSQSPMKLFEYLASGTPILSSDLPNIKEVLLEGEAIFFKQSDDKDFCDSLHYFINNANKYIDNKSLRIEKAQKYSWENRGILISNFLLNSK